MEHAAAKIIFIKAIIIKIQISQQTQRVLKSCTEEGDLKESNLN
jgi:hypothetical protein